MNAIRMRFVDDWQHRVLKAVILIFFWTFMKFWLSESLVMSFNNAEDVNPKAVATFVVIFMIFLF